MKRKVDTTVASQEVHAYERFIKLLNEPRSNYIVLEQAWHNSSLREYCLKNELVKSPYILISGLLLGRVYNSFF